MMPEVANSLPRTDTTIKKLVSGGKLTREPVFTDQIFSIWEKAPNPVRRGSAAKVRKEVLARIEALLTPGSGVDALKADNIVVMTKERIVE